MLKLFILLICFQSILTISAQQVTNVKVTQEGEKVVITYDIPSSQPWQIFDIRVECSADGGKTFSITPQSLTGDLKGIKAGTGYRIIWDVLNERQELAGDHFVFQLVAKANNPEIVRSGAANTFTDPRDGHVYKWVKIGKQIWMAENLAYKANGNSWVYKKDENYDSKYGRLYTWNLAKVISPPGWHLPSDEEWTILIDYLGGESIAGGKLKSVNDWKTPNTSADNSSDFTALPGGNRNMWGPYGGIDKAGYWWSSSEAELNCAWYRCLNYNSGRITRYSFDKYYGFSVRCVKD